MNLKQTFALSIATTALLFSVSCNTNSTSSTQQSKSVASSPYESKIDSILSKMTLEEKVGQTAEITLDVLGKGKDIFHTDYPIELDKKQLDIVLTQNKVGSILNTASNTPLTREDWQKVVSEIQDYAIKATGIPVIYGIDAIHGTTYTQGATFLPQEIAQAATFNRSLVKQGAEMCAYETRASNLPWDYSPILDNGRNPCWPRMWETFGEDTYLIAQMGVQVIQGYQGTDKNHIPYNHVAACLKHYMGYGVPTSGKDRTPSFIPENTLIEHHFEPFVRAVEAGALSVMVNSGIINGENVHASHKIITKMLKEDLNFDGVVVTDWADINNLYRRDKVASSDKEAIMISINAGVDMAMIPYDINYCKDLIELVNEGKVSKERLDDAVRRVLRLKYRLGLFDHPTVNYADYKDFASDAHKQVARNASAEAITLLKNNKNILPLSKNKRVLVTGPNANSMRTLNGGWTLSWQGEKVDQYEKNGSTFLKSIQNLVGSDKVTYVPGVEYKMDGQYFEEQTPNIAAAVAAARKVDVILVFVGENTYTEKPGDLNDLYLSDNQQELVKALAATGKPVVMVLNEGRPRIISKIEPLVSGIIQTYYSGSYAGEATAKVIYGDLNPSGKLPYTYPKYPNSLITYDYKPSENQEKMEGAYNYMSDQSIQYGFGFGLSYTTFSYSNLKVAQSQFTSSDSIQISVDVKNTGKVDGKEAVLFFISDEVASITPDNRRLRAFEKINLKAGETKTVTVKIPASDLAFVNMENKWIMEAGTFKVQVADQVTTMEATDSKTWSNAFRN